MGGFTVLVKFMFCIISIYGIIFALMFFFCHGDLNKEYRESKENHTQEIVLSESSNPPLTVTIEETKDNKAKIIKANYYKN